MAQEMGCCENAIPTTLHNFRLSWLKKWDVAKNATTNMLGIHGSRCSPILAVIIET
jgi:hypothetical protein